MWVCDESAPSGGYIFRCEASRIRSLPLEGGAVRRRRVAEGVTAVRLSDPFEHTQALQTPSVTPAACHLPHEGGFVSSLRGLKPFFVRLAWIPIVTYEVPKGYLGLSRGNIMHGAAFLNPSLTRHSPVLPPPLPVPFSKTVHCVFCMARPPRTRPSNHGASGRGTSVCAPGGTVQHVRPVVEGW